MTAFLFPTPDRLRLALASGVVPSALAAAPVRAAVDDHGRVLVQPDAFPPREVLAAFARFGVQILGGEEMPSQSVRCWAELLPLRKAAHEGRERPGIVLFELPDTRLARLAGTLRRAASRPVGVHLLEGAQRGRAWLVCESPPLDVLLRCAEADSGIEVFTEQVSGVWVCWRWEHPLPEQLVRPPGAVLLLRPPQCVTVHDAPIPAPTIEEYRIRAASRPKALAFSPPTVPVRLHLKPRSDSPPATVWVFAGAEIEAFRDFCRSADEALLQHFEAAQGTIAGGSRLLIRPARGKQATPPLPFPTGEYFTDAQGPGLFLPAGQALRPAVRAVELTRLFGVRANRLTWLEAGPGGTVIAHSLPVGAFRPLRSGLEYTTPESVRLTADPTPPEAFPFAPFVLAEQSDALAPEANEVSPLPKSPLIRDRSSPPERAGWWVRSLERIVGRFRRSHLPASGIVPPVEPEPSLLPAKPPRQSPRLSPVRLNHKLSSADALLHGPDRAARRHELEAALLSEFPRLTPEQRATGWADLAAVYGATGNPTDAAVCWMNAAWESDAPPAVWLEQWLHAESHAARQREPLPHLDRWLGEPGRFGAGRVVAAYTVWAAHHPAAHGELLPALPRVLAFLDQHFDDIPTRAAWLARHAAARLSAGDPLGLARWRDRLLARLRDKGPSLDLDEPSFLRFHGTASPDRFRTARDWLARTRKPILDWLGRLASTGRLQWAGLDAETACTAAYAQLMLAWGLGCLGERTRSRDGAARARKLLASPARPGVDPAVHALLADAFAHRIRDVQEGRATTSGLSPDLLARCEQLGNFSRYAVDRLRDHCRILEPTGRSAAFRGLDLRGFRGADRLGERLHLLADSTDAAYVSAEAEQILALCEVAPTSATVPRVTLTLLELAAFLDAPTVGRVLGLVLPAAAWLEPWLLVGRWTESERADHLPRYLSRLLGSAFSAATAFNQGPAVRPLVEYLLNRCLVDGSLRDAVGRAAGPLFRAFRKLGFRAEAEALLQVLDPHRGEWPADAPLLPARLGLAVGWFAAGDEDAGNRILDDARQRLFVTRTGDDRDRTELAIAYAEALGASPPRIALGRLEEIFQGLDRITLTGSTNRYYTLKPLQLIDAVVRSVVTDDFALGPAVRGWLDDDEFLIRRRIHRDMANVLRTDGIA